MRAVILEFKDFLSKNAIQSYEFEAAKTWFPVVASKELAAMAAALMSDGHIAFQLRNGKPKMCKIVLYSNDKSECSWFLKLIDSLFKVKGRIIRYRSTTGFSKTYSYKAVVHCSSLAKLLVAIGIPCGDKTRTAYEIPRWVMRGAYEIKQSFLKTLFNFDGSISIRSRRATAIELNFVTNRHKDFVKSGKIFLEQLANLLSEFGVQSGKIHIRYCKKDKFTLMLFITNSRSILNFHKYICFLNKKKNSRLSLAASRLRLYRRIKYGSHLLQELKQNSGTDRNAVEKINKLSKLEYTYRQFEHMRRGESDIPVDMLNATLKLLGKAPIDPLDFIASREPH